MRNTIGHVSFFITILGLMGCATPYPNSITPEIKQKAKTVSVMEKVYAAAGIPHGGEDANPGVGALPNLVVGIGIAQRKNAYNEALLKAVDPAVFLSGKLSETFRLRLSKVSSFNLSGDSGSAADAAFVLEVRQMTFAYNPDESAFSFQRKWLAQVVVRASLVANPPFETAWDENGKLSIADPEQHPILFQQTVTGDDRTGDAKDRYDHINYYLVKEVYEKAFGLAVVDAVDKLVATW